MEIGHFCIFSSFPLPVDPYQHSVFILHGLGGVCPEPMNSSYWR